MTVLTERLGRADGASSRSDGPVPLAVDSRQTTPFYIVPEVRELEDRRVGANHREVIKRRVSA